MAGSAPSNPFDQEPDRGSGGAHDPVAVSGALLHQRMVRDLLPGATPPTFSFTSLTRRPDQVGLDAARLAELVAPPAPMPTLTVPDAVAPVTSPTPIDEDPLTPVV